jgi:hypothetical protein
MRPPIERIEVPIRELEALLDKVRSPLGGKDTESSGVRWKRFQMDQVFSAQAWPSQHQSKTSTG